MASSFSLIEKELHSKANPEKSEGLKRFFKTRKGEYGEGDTFIGINMPNIRMIAKTHIKTDLSEVTHLISHHIHEFRICGFILLTYKYKKATNKEKEEIIKFYLSNLDHCNNWDLVDCSASELLGDFLQNKDANILDELADSGHLWRQRISIIATHAFIRKEKYEHTLRISKKLLLHEHDLIHKAVGWMLREIGNRNHEVETDFLKKHYSKMPRTMLRYAIEKFPQEERIAYLKGLI